MVQGEIWGWGGGEGGEKEGGKEGEGEGGEAVCEGVGGGKVGCGVL